MRRLALLLPLASSLVLACNDDAPQTTQTGSSTATSTSESESSMPTTDESGESETGTPPDLPSPQGCTGRSSGRACRTTAPRSSSTAG